MALGADRRLVMRMILGEGIARLGTGIVIGVVVMYFAARVLKPLLYHVSPRDPLVIAAAISGILISGVLAALFPAVRAMRLDLSATLRQD
jgi:ABC-type antimicrobial peptide transport system permease subunit